MESLYGITIIFISFLVVASNSLLVRPTTSLLKLARTQSHLSAKPLERMMKNPKKRICNFCGEEFESRNAIFRHLRSSKTCYALAQSHGRSNGEKNSFHNQLNLEKRKVAIQFGYYVTDNDLRYSNDAAARIVSFAFFQALQSLYPSSPLEEEDCKNNFTLATAAQLRHPSLMQEHSCSAFGDVIGINYKGGPDILDAKRLVKQMQDAISDNGEPLRVRVLNVESLGVSTKFHAEKSCSQRSYHYLVPITWLDDSVETLEWIRDKVNPGNKGHQIQKGNTPASLVKLKKSLKLAESRIVTEFTVPAASSSGRFGKLMHKEKRPFHNFCEPFLVSKGMANPSNENVWRSVDKARLSGFKIDEHNQNEAFVVVEFLGDGFVTQQVRRMVAAVIGISNGWLPTEYFDVATRLDVSIETPIAPPGLLYFSSPRFHFIDLVRGSSLFDSKETEYSRELWLNSLQNLLLHARSEKTKEEEASWLKDLRDSGNLSILPLFRQILLNDAVRAKKITRRGRESIKNDLEVEEGDLSVAPEPYHKTLSLLQDISGSDKWPATPDAISRVIRSPIGTLIDEMESINKNMAVSSQFKGHLYGSFSFTITNPQTFQGKITSLNKKYPELVDAIFELESYLNSECKRNIMTDVQGQVLPPSHCIVSRNVEFTPHIPNGKGEEQSYSMIVGLGNYVRGEFVADGESYNIRYDPLRFDRWNQIHSTARFGGEQFTLIWFTPERRKTQASGGSPRFEDIKANQLVKAHAQTLDTYPPITYRQNSTDALVINEILDTDKGCAYELSPRTWLEITKDIVGQDESDAGFSLRGHKAVLDIGAHIGIFSRYALIAGCESIVAFEPEAENLKLLRQNLKLLASTESKVKDRVQVYPYAVAHGEPGIQSFVNARNRTDGSLNTWRHSLEKHSSYVDKEGTKLTSKTQASVLSRSQVHTMPFFGDSGALVPGITLVKMDCEGAELDILLSKDAAQSSKWLDVKQLVFEWSFTKERRVDKFHTAVQNLESAGFVVAYEGRYSWWDTEQNCMWPYHTDIIVFAKRQLCM